MLSNYSLKKLLPKLIIVAIAVNISYDLCVMFVDLSNLLGYGLASIFNVIIPESAGTTTAMESFGEFATTALTGGLVIGVVGVALAVGIPAMLFAALSLLLTALILMVRQGLILLLVIISPLAFVAWLLPNTENLFKKWRSVFTTMLLLFPMIGLLFGASSVAAKIINNAAGDNLVLQLSALVVMVGPLILVIPLTQGALKAIGSAGTSLANLAGRSNKAIGKQAMNSKNIGGMRNAWDNRKKQWEIDKAAKRANQGQYNPARVARRIVGGEKYINNEKTYAAKLKSAETKEAVEAAASNYSELSASSGSMEAGKRGALEEIMAGGKSREEIMALSDMVMSQGGANQRRQLMEHLARDPQTKDDKDVLRRAGQAAFNKGDHEFFGKKFADDLVDGKMSEPGAFDQAINKHLESGEFNAASVGKSTTMAKNLRDMYLGQGDYSGKNPLSDKARANLQAASYDALNDRDLQATLGVGENSTRDSLTRISQGYQPPTSPDTTTNIPQFSGPQLRGGETQTDSGLVIPRNMK